jgi:hypothetical protein
MKTTVARAMVFLLWAGACSAAPPTPLPPLVTVAPLPADAGATPAGEPAILAVVAARAPRQVSVDGDLAEWGVLPVPVPSVPRPPEGRIEDDVLPNPPAAASRLALAVTGQEAFVAAELDEQARRGIWLGIGAHVPALPPLGEPGGRAGFVRLQCEFELICWAAGENNDATACGPDKEKPLTPEVVESCKGLLKQHAELVAAHAEKFHKIFRVDRDGVRVLGPEGRLAPVPGSRHAWKPRAEGATVEIALPLAALPRVAEAPLEALTLMARAVDGPAPPEIPPEQWVRVVLPDPISFEPYGVLRTDIFAQQRRGDEKDPQGIFYNPQELGHGMSYQPGEPLYFEAMSFGFQVSVVTQDGHELYKKSGTIGAVEVGIVDYADEDAHLALWKDGKLATVIAIPGAIKTVLTRAGELHALAFGAGHHPDERWSGVAVGPDGKHREVVEPVKLRADKKEPSWWSGVTSFSSPDFETFGWRGHQTHRAVEVTWRWDPARRLYRGSARPLLLPPKKKPAKK